MKLGNTDAAVADYQVLTRDTSTQYGAQAIVELSQYAYDTKQYKSAEEILNRFVNSGTSHTYWLARAFVLLSDVFAQTDRTIEARQYLLSLKSNYTESEEINKMIEERLKNL
jgi:predicted negative regulator of RcsB-dependent stress response